MGLSGLGFSETQLNFRAKERDDDEGDRILISCMIITRAHHTGSIVGPISHVTPGKPKS